MTICWHYQKTPEGSGLPAGEGPGRLELADWTSFGEVAAGTREIRIRDVSGIHRVMYVAKFEEAIYVLHCFQKKTQVTSEQDKVLVAARYRAVVRARKEKK